MPCHFHSMQQRRPNGRKNQFMSDTMETASERIGDSWCGVHLCMQEVGREKGCVETFLSLKNAWHLASKTRGILRLLEFGAQSCQQALPGGPPNERTPGMEHEDYNISTSRKQGHSRQLRMCERRHPLHAPPSVPSPPLPSPPLPSCHLTSCSASMRPSASVFTARSTNGPQPADTCEVQRGWGWGWVWGRATESGMRGGQG